MIPKVQQNSKLQIRHFTESQNSDCHTLRGNYIFKGNNFSRTKTRSSLKKIRMTSSSLVRTLETELQNVVWQDGKENLFYTSSVFITDGTQIYTAHPHSTTLPTFHHRGETHNITAVHIHTHTKKPTPEFPTTSGHRFRHYCLKSATVFIETDKAPHG